MYILQIYIFNYLAIIYFWNVCKNKYVHACISHKVYNNTIFNLYERTPENFTQYHTAITKVAV